MAYLRGLNRVWIPCVFGLSNNLNIQKCQNTFPSSARNFGVASFAFRLAFQFFRVTEKKIEKSHFQFCCFFSLSSVPPFSVSVLLCSCQSSEHVVTMRKALLDALLTTQTVAAFKFSTAPILSIHSGQA